eukprot:759868-Pelagomonas_calceolata.AAC.1
METLPTSIKEGGTLAQKSCDSPLAQSCKIKSANGDLEGNWKHRAPGPGCDPNYVQPNGAGITNTIVRAELAAITAAILQGHSHIASASLFSLHQIRK